MAPALTRALLDVAARTATVYLALLLGLTFFAFYNDINRLFTG